MPKAKAKDQVVEAEEVAVEETVVENKVTSQKDATDERREPRPDSPKDIVFQAGRQDEPGSIAAVAELTGKTQSNVRQHITQCHTSLGYGYTVMGDAFTIDGETTNSWNDQLAAKEAAKAAKAPKEEAPEVGEVVETEEGDDDIL